MCASRTVVLAQAAVIALVPALAMAAIEADHPAAYLSLPAAGAATAIEGGDFSIVGWVRPAALPAEGDANILHVDNALRLTLLSDGSVQAAFQQSGGPQLSVTTTASLTAGQWALVSVSFEAAAGALSLATVSESSPLETHVAAKPGFTPGPAGPALRIGANGEHQAMVGTYGVITVRNHVVTSSDLTHLWTQRRYHGPYSTSNTNDGGTLNGLEGCIWMINHAMTTRPIDGGVGGDSAERAAVVDAEVTRRNTHVYDITASISPTSLRVVRPLLDVAGLVHRSPYEQPAGSGAGSFFIRDLPELTEHIRPPYFRTHVSPKARLLTSEPIGLVRVIASANSRGIQSGDGSADGTGNFVHGFLWNHKHQTAGVINRPARIDAGPWFGFDASEHAPFATAGVSSLIASDFSRFWTSANAGNSIGPGQGVHVAPGASFAMRCKPQGLIQANHPLMVQAHLLQYPGASAVQWKPNQHSRQGQSGIDAAPVTTVPLNTTQWSHTFDTNAGDAMVTNTRMALAGNHVANIGVGDACSVGPSSISIISAVTYDDTTQRTLIDFEHQFAAPPTSGSTLRFGPWSFTTISYLWPGLSAGDTSTWRGLKLTAADDGEGMVLFSFDAWRPGVDGFIFGAAGWGGNGYQPQIQRSFSGAIAGWVAQLNPDVWLQMPATQITNVTWMDLYTARIRAGAPDMEVVWLGDIAHPSAWDSHIWHKWILDRAGQNGVASATLLMHPDLGDQLDLFADGIRSDILHISQRGNQRLATLWTELLEEAALPGPHPIKLGDLDGSGVVNVSDLLNVLGNWGTCANANACTGDLNGDGRVDVSDLLILLSNWG